MPQVIDGIITKSDMILIVNNVLIALKNHRRSLSGDELKVMCCANERQVRLAISTLRLQGHLIVGYWPNYHFAQNHAEVEQVALELDNRARILQETAAAMRSAARSARLNM